MCLGCIPPTHHPPHPTPPAARSGRSQAPDMSAPPSILNSAATTSLGEVSSRALTGKTGSFGYMAPVRRTWAGCSGGVQCGRAATSAVQSVQGATLPHKSLLTLSLPPHPLCTLDCRRCPATRTTTLRQTSSLWACACKGPCLCMLIGCWFRRAVSERAAAELAHSYPCPCPAQVQPLLPHHPHFHPH